MSHFSNNFSTTMQKLERVKSFVIVNSWENVVSKKLVMLIAKFGGFAMSYSLLPSKRRGSSNSLLKEE